MFDISDALENAEPIEVNLDSWIIHLSVSNTKRRKSVKVFLRDKICAENILKNIEDELLRNFISSNGLLNNLDYDLLKTQHSIVSHEWVQNSATLFNISILTNDEY